LVLTRWNVCFSRSVVKDIVQRVAAYRHDGWYIRPGDAR
jgi:hypothetical protein